MSLTPLGELTIGTVIPGAYGAIGLAVSDLQARVSALLAFSASVTPPSFSADFALAGQIAFNLQAAMSIGLTPPSMSAQLAIVAGLLAKLQADLSLILAIPFATAGVSAYAYDGNANAMGADVSTQFSGDTAHANALLLVVESAAVWSDFSTVFKVGP